MEMPRSRKTIIETHNLTREFKNVVVRSDTSDLERNVQETALKMRLNNLDAKNIETYAEALYKKLLGGSLDPVYVSYPAGIRKDSLKKYKTLPAHIKAVIYSNNYLNTDFRPGDKPRRLPIKPSVNLFGRAVFGCRGRQYKLKDIAIDEYVKIPEEYLESIDWQRIQERLKGKVIRIQNLEDQD